MTDQSIARFLKHHPVFETYWYCLPSVFQKPGDVSKTGRCIDRSFEIAVYRWIFRIYSSTTTHWKADNYKNMKKLSKITYLLYFHYKINVFVYGTKEKHQNIRKNSGKNNKNWIYLIYWIQNIYYFYFFILLFLRWLE